MPVLLALLIIALSTHSQAASLVLVGPAQVHVGDLASYSLQVALEPGETIRGSSGQLMFEGGRSLVSINPSFVDGRALRGFFDAGYIVDVADYVNSHTRDQDPVLLEWGID